MRFVRRTCWVAVVVVLLAGCEAKAADLYETATKTGQFQTFLRGLKATGLLRTLRGKGPFTVFAPTDAAFAKLADLDKLQRPDHAEAFSKLLALHIVSREVPAEKLRGREAGFMSLSGAEIHIDGRGDDILVQGAKVVTPDIFAGNGVMHVIDSVLLPVGYGIK